MAGVQPVAVTSAAFQTTVGAYPDSSAPPVQPWRPSARAIANMVRRALAVFTVMESLNGEAHRHIPGYHGGMAFQINFGQIQVARDLLWPGLFWNGSLILSRLAWVAVACFLALAASVIFDRFDSTKAKQPTPKKRNGAFANAAPATEAMTPRVINVHLRPLGANSRSAAFGRIFLAELRLALQGLHCWWFAIALGLPVAQFASPLEISRGPLLGAAWIWPILLWSGMGTRESRFGIRPILFSCANLLPRQLLACWLAGAAIALLTGSSAAVRLAMAAQRSSLLAILAGALFIPALALALGVISGSSKFFEALFSVLWYVGPMNKTPGLDFTGAAGGLRTPLNLIVYAAITIGLLAAAFFWRARQLRSN